MNTEYTGKESSCLLEWRVHLLQIAPGRMPLLILAIGVAAVCIWLMFRSWLPSIAAIMLLVGATREYLFPLTYRITSEGVFVQGMLIQSAITWEALRRLLPDANGVILTPLADASRLDAFRGVCVRFAPDGQPGDRDSVMEIVRRFVPTLKPESVAVDGRD